MASKKCSKKRRTKQYRPSGREFFCNPVGAALLKVSHINHADRDQYLELSRRALDLLAVDSCPHSEFDELASMSGVACRLADMGVCSDAESVQILVDGATCIAEIGECIRDKRSTSAMRSHIDRIAAMIERHEIQLMYASAADVDTARKLYQEDERKFMTQAKAAQSTPEMAVAP